MRNVEVAVRYLLGIGLCVGLLSGCDEGFPWETDGKKDESIDPCSPTPTNTTFESAEVLTLDRAQIGRFCRETAAGRGYWKTESQFDPEDQLRLHVVFDRAENAEDIDFAVGVPSGGSVESTLVRGSCSNPAGQFEDCTVQLDIPNPVLEIYVVSTPGENAREEAFRITLTRVIPPTP